MDLALRESEERFRSVFRDARIGMVIVSLDGRFIAVNHAFCEFLGYSEEELLRKDVASITYPKDLHSSDEIFKAPAYLLETVHCLKGLSASYARSSSSTPMG